MVSSPASFLTVLGNMGELIKYRPMGFSNRGLTAEHSS